MMGWIRRGVASLSNYTLGGFIVMAQAVLLARAERDSDGSLGPRTSGRLLS
jgi:hypothetical protein